MNLSLGLRTLLLLAFVTAATAVLLHPGQDAAAAGANAVPMLMRN